MISLLRLLGLNRPSFYIGGILGFAGGLAVMLIAFPFLFPPLVLNEAAPEAEVVAETEQVKRIPFRFDQNAPGRDPIHWADGTGAMIPTRQGWLLRFESDFKAGPGPNYRIYLNTRAVGDETDFSADTERLMLAPLKSFTGSQNFILPEMVNGKPFDPAGFHTVTIWCESFGVYIGSARLEK